MEVDFSEQLTISQFPALDVLVEPAESAHLSNSGERELFQIVKEQFDFSENPRLPDVHRRTRRQVEYESRIWPGNSRFFKSMDIFDIFDIFAFL